jgi:hypothetical protein
MWIEPKLAGDVGTIFIMDYNGFLSKELAMS